MTMLSKYHVPGLAIEDHSIDVPLDWTGHEPGRAFDGETIKLFDFGGAHQQAVPAAPARASTARPPTDGSRRPSGTSG